jgi:outer membrane lipoprotein SlyB
MRTFGRTKTVVGILLFAAGILSFVAGAALAQDPIVYPAKGQSEKQMEKDKYECYSWAKKQTGFDPMATPTATRPAPPSSNASTAGGAVKGGAIGALGGLAIGALAGNSKKGALIGGGSGALIGGVTSHNERKRSDQAQHRI